MPLTAAQSELLQAIAHGSTLKAHRDLEGRKEYRLHTLDGQSTLIAWADAEALQDAGLIDSNKKFPAATYWLTTRGRTLLGLS